jgi:hypothetical protein
MLGACRGGAGGVDATPSFDASPCATDPLTQGCPCELGVDPAEGCSSQDCIDCINWCGGIVYSCVECDTPGCDGGIISVGHCDPGDCFADAGV